MSVEMACGSCQGRFLVNVAGTVACPHCGAHLIVSPDDCPPTDDAATQPILPPAKIDEPAATAETTAPVTEMFASYASLADAGQTAADESVSAGAMVSPDAEPADDNSVDGDSGSGGGEAFSQEEERDADRTQAETDAGPAAASASDNGEAEAPTLTFTEPSPSVEGIVVEQPPPAEFEGGDFSFGESVDDPEIGDAFPDFSGGGVDEDDGDNRAARLVGSGGGETTAIENSIELGHAPETQDPVTPAKTTAGASDSADRGLPKAWFLILASYASAITIVCLWLLTQLISGTHQLESLEDPAEAPVRNKKKIVKLFQIDAELPRGHVLRLGESRRFGNIFVEPIKVTRGPLEFVHFNSEHGVAKQPTEPTLKLWLRLENRSDDQTIAPLDSLLLYTNRVRGKENYEQLRGNTFVCRASDKRKGGDLVYVYELNTNDVWDLRGQPLEPLGPGESCVTYIPATPEGIDTLKGNLVWRVHLRKGYSPTKHGITTLIEVNFDSGQIQVEPAAAKKATAAL